MRQRHTFPTNRPIYVFGYPTFGEVYLCQHTKHPFYLWKDPQNNELPITTLDAAELFLAIAHKFVDTFIQTIPYTDLTTLHGVITDVQAHIIIAKKKPWPEVLQYPMNSNSQSKARKDETE